MKKRLTLMLMVLLSGCGRQPENSGPTQLLDVDSREAARRGEARVHEGIDEGEYYPVTGVVTYDGKPLADASLRFQVDGGAASRIYSCTSKEDGSFVVETPFTQGVKAGTPVGDYRVLIGKFGGDPPPAASGGDADESQEQPESKSRLNPYDSPRNHIVEKFNNGLTTPLRMSVKAGENSFSIVLKSDGSGEVIDRAQFPAK